MERKRCFEHKKFTNFMLTYPYSSYHDYFQNGRKESVILSKNILPDYIQDIDGISELITSFHESKEEEVEM